MKKTLVLVVLLLSITSANIFAQIRKIPAEVTDAFKTKFPKAENVEWKDNLTNFQASFAMSGTDWTAEFSGKGDWKETNKKISFEALPASVKDGFSKSKFSDWTPGSVTFIEKEGKDPQYKIYAEKSSVVQKRFLFFNTSGQLEKEAPGI